MSNLETLQAAIKSQLNAHLLLQTVPGTGLELWLVDPQIDVRTLPSSGLDQVPYWAIAWSAGVAVATMLKRGEMDVSQKSVLDYGCGSAIAAIAAARAGAGSVLAYDIDPVALVAAQHNAAINGTKIKTTDDISQVPQKFDICIVADFLYDDDNVHVLNQARQCCDELWLLESRGTTPAHAREIGRVEARSFPVDNESSAYNSVRVLKLQG